MDFEARIQNYGTLTWPSGIEDLWICRETNSQFEHRAAQWYTEMDPPVCIWVVVKDLIQFTTMGICSK